MLLCSASGISGICSILTKILQRGWYAPIPAQGRADPAYRPDCRSCAGNASSGRTAPPLFQSVSFRQGQIIVCTRRQARGREPLLPPAGYYGAPHRLAASSTPFWPNPAGFRQTAHNGSACEWICAARPLRSAEGLSEIPVSSRWASKREDRSNVPI